MAQQHYHAIRQLILMHQNEVHWLAAAVEQSADHLALEWIKYLFGEFSVLLPLPLYSELYQTMVTSLVVNLSLKTQKSRWILLFGVDDTK